MDLGRTALLVIDMQNDFILKEGAAARLGSCLWEEVEKRRIIRNVRKVVSKARNFAIPIFHVRTAYREDYSDVTSTVTDFSLQLQKYDSRKSPKDYMKEISLAFDGAWGSRFVKGLQPAKGDYVITKKRSSAFYNTDIELHLNSLNVHTLIITGIATEACVDATIHDAENRDFTIIVPADCTAASDGALQEFWMKHVLPKHAVTMSSAELIQTLCETRESACSQKGL